MRISLFIGQSAEMNAELADRGAIDQAIFIQLCAALRRQA